MSWRFDKSVLSYESKLSGIVFPDVLQQLVHPDVWARVDLHNESLPVPEMRITKGKVDTKNSYIEWILQGKTGYVSAAFDGIRLVIEAYAATAASKLVRIFCAALRDRQKDGTGVTSTSYTPLSTFTNDGHFFSRLELPDLHTAELTIYSWDADTILPKIDQPGTLDHFIAEPDFYIFARDFNWTNYFSLWKQAVLSNRAPWQKGLPMKGVARHFISASASLLTKLGYDVIDEVPCWYNVAAFFQSLGYRFTFGEHHLVYEQLKSILEERFPKFSLYQQSWLVALQNIPSGFIPDPLRLSLPKHPELVLRYPYNELHEDLPRMYYPLSRYAQNHFGTPCLYRSPLEVGSDPADKQLLELLQN